MCGDVVASGLCDSALVECVLFLDLSAEFWCTTRLFSWFGCYLELFYCSFYRLLDCSNLAVCSAVCWGVVVGCGDVLFDGVKNFRFLFVVPGSGESFGFVLRSSFSWCMEDGIYWEVVGDGGAVGSCCDWGVCHGGHDHVDQC